MLSRVRIAPALGAIAAIALFAATFTLFIGSPAGQIGDERAMQTWAGALGNDVPTSGWLGDHQLAVLALIGVVLGVICLARRSARLAAHAALLVLLSVGAAVVLKQGLDRPSFGVGVLVNSFPSNTVAAFAAAAFALVAISPATIRPIVAFGAVLGAGIVSVTVVGLQWHRPSDVIGGWLLAVAAACVAECVVPVRTAVSQVASVGQVPWRA